MLWLQGASTVTWAANENLTEATWRMTRLDNKLPTLRVPRRMLALTPRWFYERKPFSTASDEYAFTLVRCDLAG